MCGVLSAGCRQLIGLEEEDEAPIKNEAQLCSALTNPVLIYGSDSITPIVEEVGPAFAKRPGDSAITLVYVVDRSCEAIASIYDEANSNFKNQKKACYFDTEKVYGGGDCAERGAKECVLDGSLKVDIGVSDIFPETCGAAPDPDVIHKQGPIQASIFVNPLLATPTAITKAQAKAAYDPALTPMSGEWDDETYVYHRGPTSGTQRLMAKFLDMEPTAKMRGLTTFESSSDLIAAVEAANGQKDYQDKVLGMYDASNAEKPRETSAAYKVLQVQVDPLLPAVFPDGDGRDKANVRSGDYTIWSPMHFVLRASSPNKSNVDLVVNLLTLTAGSSFEGAPAKRVFEIWVNGSFIPQCAMTKRRTSEMGAYDNNTPDCVCSFMLTLGLQKNLPPGCKACADTTACMGLGLCNPLYGYCEQ